MPENFFKFHFAQKSISKSLDWGKGVLSSFNPASTASASWPGYRWSSISNKEYFWAPVVQKYVIKNTNQDTAIASSPAGGQCAAGSAAYAKETSRGRRPRACLLSASPLLIYSCFTRPQLNVALQLQVHHWENWMVAPTGPR